MIGSRQARKLSQKANVLKYTVGDLKRTTNVVENIVAAENFPLFRAPCFVFNATPLRGEQAGLQGIFQ